MAREPSCRSSRSRHIPPAPPCPMPLSHLLTSDVDRLVGPVGNKTGNKNSGAPVKPGPHSRRETPHLSHAKGNGMLLFKKNYSKSTSPHEWFIHKCGAGRNAHKTARVLEHNQTLSEPRGWLDPRETNGPYSNPRRGMDTLVSPLLLHSTYENPSHIPLNSRNFFCRSAVEVCLGVSNSYFGKTTIFPRITFPAGQRSRHKNSYSASFKPSRKKYLVSPGEIVS